MSNFPTNAADLSPHSLNSALRFRDEVEERCNGSVEHDQKWRGADAKYHVICSRGHQREVKANNINNGQGICYQCTRGADAEKQFHQRVQALGGIVEPNQQWIGTRKKYRVTCSEGHKCEVKPNSIQQGQSICVRCARKVDQAKKNFYDTVRSLGGKVESGQEWRGFHMKYRVTCSEGHKYEVWPGNVQQGSGICGECYISYDVFYILTHCINGCIKFGISSGDPKRRLSEHASLGYTDVEFLRTSLPPRMARDTENHILNDLWAAGYQSVQGKEYFGPEAREFILDLAQNYLSDEKITEHTEAA